MLFITWAYRISFKSYFWLIYKHAFVYRFIPLLAAQPRVGESLIRRPQLGAFGAIALP